jgi:sugar phosphate isomerase/epimerase
MPSLSLDCLTLSDASPVELIRVAAKAGFSSVSLWVQPPAITETMLARPEMRSDIAHASSDYGIAIGNLEVFNLNGDEDVDSFADTLAFGASLGATSATAIDFGPHREDMPERLARFHSLCARFGLRAYFEPISMGTTRTLEEGARLIEAAGVGAKLVVDLLHLVRTGGTPETISSIAAERIAYVQLCDGPLHVPEEQLAEEATAQRLYPGEGEFPLVDCLRHIPGHAMLGLETPSATRQERGLTALDRAQAARRAADALFRRVEETKS